MAHPVVITNLIGVITGPSYDNIIMSDPLNGQLLGGHLDELIRHHPTLYPVVLASLLQLLKKASDESTGFVVPPDRAGDFGIGGAPSGVARTNDNEDSARLTPLNAPLLALTKMFRVSYCFLVMADLLASRRHIA